MESFEDNGAQVAKIGLLESIHKGWKCAMISSQNDWFLINKGAREGADIFY